MLGQNESHVHTPARSCGFKKGGDSCSYTTQACFMETERVRETCIWGTRLCSLQSRPKPTTHMDPRGEHTAAQNSAEDRKMILLEIQQQECCGGKQPTGLGFAYTLSVH